ncbi:MAG: glycosyltransferase, partial [Oceanidesulfovibrio sp.]
SGLGKARVLSVLCGVPVAGKVFSYGRALVAFPRLMRDYLDLRERFWELSEAFEQRVGGVFPDHVYWELEEHFRGSPKEIEKTFAIYLPYVRERIREGEVVLDLGCGRGEWLAMLRRNGIHGQGVDSNETMVRQTRVRGFTVAHASALDHLQTLPDNSLAVVTAFHLMEHLPPDGLVRLWEETYRVLRPGGMLLFETPNPENVQVGTYYFYLDPTHKSPIPPPLACRILEALGFRDVGIQRSQEVEPPVFANPELDRFFSCGMNYAVLAYKEDAYADKHAHEEHRPLQTPEEIESLVVSGPFTGSYSLSMVNREMALALESRMPGRVALCFEETPSLRPGATAELAPGEPQLHPLQQRCREIETPDAVVYNSYPPHVLRLPGSLAMTNAYGWEESEFPDQFVEEFNSQLDGLTVMSSYVLKPLQNNGVNRPMRVAGLGIDHIDRDAPKPVPHYLGRGFRFLHISSCFPRKGVDVLLQAYGQAFSAADDVTLVIKTFPNPHNDAPAMVEEFSSRDDAPEVVLINEDLAQEEILTLYKKCHCLVAPSRGEGFGLPMAEAMALGMPVITTGYGGQTDFCTNDTAWLIDYSFAQAKSHLSAPGSLWVEPHAGHLAELMHAIRRADPEDIKPRTDAAMRLVRSEYTWQAAAKRLLDAIAHVRDADADRPMRLAWVSTWNARCGIAEYSRYLVEQLDENLDVLVLAPKSDERLGVDEKNVRRVWNGESIHEQLPDIVQNAGVECVVLNIHPAFYTPKAFRNLLRELHQRKVRVLALFHNTKDCESMFETARDELAQADRLLVHGVEDMNRLKHHGLADNAALFPHGVCVFNPDRAQPSQEMPERFRGRRLIASSGFLMPHKGIHELIQAFSILFKDDPNLGLLLVNALYPRDKDLEYYKRCSELIVQEGVQDGVHLIPEFLDLDESLWLLNQAELIVYPYAATAESSSAAVRMGLAADRPVVCTNLPIFREVGQCIHTLPGHEPADIAQGVRALLDDAAALHARDDARRQWLRRYAWPRVGRRLSGLVRSGVLSAKKHG